MPVIKSSTSVLTEDLYKLKEKPDKTLPGTFISQMEKSPRFPEAKEFIWKNIRLTHKKLFLAMKEKFSEIPFSYQTLYKILARMKIEEGIKSDEEMYALQKDEQERILGEKENQMARFHEQRKKHSVAIKLAAMGRVKHFGVAPDILRRGQNDPAYFAENILGVRLHPGQKFFLRLFLIFKKLVFAPSNQYGKSFMVAVIHIWAAFYKFNLKGWDEDESWITNKGLVFQKYKTVNMAPRLEQASQVYEYILLILQSQFFWDNDPDGVKSDYIHNECRLQNFLIEPLKLPSRYLVSGKPIIYSNGAETKIVCTKGDKGAMIQGQQFGLISMDECALEPGLEDMVMARLPSRLVKHDGTLCLISTADADAQESGAESQSNTYEFYEKLVMTGMNNTEPYHSLFAELWEEKGSRSITDILNEIKSKAGEETDTWKSFLGKMTDNIFLSKKIIAKKRKEIEEDSPEMAQQIFEGIFVGNVGKYFNADAVKNLFSGDWETQEAKSGRTYCIGCDFAAGKVFYTVYTVCDITDWRDGFVPIVKIIRYRGNSKNPQNQIQELIELAEEYNDADVAIDASSLGGSVIQSYLDTINTFPNGFRAEGKKELMFALRKFLLYNNNEGKFRAPAPDGKLNADPFMALKRELNAYREDDKRLIKDCVMSLGLVAWRLEQLVQEDDVPIMTYFDPLSSAESVQFWN